MQEANTEVDTQLEHRVQQIIGRSLYRRDFTDPNVLLNSSEKLVTTSRSTVPLQSPKKEPLNLQVPTGRYSHCPDKFAPKPGIVPGAVSPLQMSMKHRSTTYSEEISLHGTTGTPSSGKGWSEPLPRYLVGNHVKKDTLIEAIKRSTGEERESLQRILQALEDRDAQYESWQRKSTPRWITRWPGPFY